MPTKAASRPCRSMQYRAQYVQGGLPSAERAPAPTANEDCRQLPTADDCRLRLPIVSRRQSALHSAVRVGRRCRCRCEL